MVRQRPVQDPRDGRCSGTNNDSSSNPILKSTRWTLRRAEPMKENNGQESSAVGPQWTGRVRQGRAGLGQGARVGEARRLVSSLTTAAQPSPRRSKSRERSGAGTRSPPRHS